MEIEKTPLWKEANEIMVNGNTESRVAWDAVIHLGNKENETVKPLALMLFSVHRDYHFQYADHISCILTIPFGKYSRRVYPNRNTLQISITKTHLIGLTMIPDKDKPIETERYSATLVDTNPSPVIAQGRETNDEFTLDLMGIPDIQFQLYSKNIEQIRMMTVGGSFRKTTISNVIKSLLTTESKKAKVDDKLKLDGVDMVEASNKIEKEHVIITHGIKLTDLANYLQNKYGVYNTGLGSYIQNKLWYVFPLFDTTQFEKREKNVTILVLPTNKCPEIVKSYKKKGDSTTILISSNTGFKDDSGTQYLNFGNGVRLGDANKYMEDYSKTEDNKTRIVRAKNNSEFLSEERPDGINNVSITGSRITANPFLVYSNLNARNGGAFQCVWENSDVTVIHPGMLAKIVYFDESEVKELTGVIHVAQHVSAKIADISTSRHTTNTFLTIFVANKIKQNT